MVAPSGAAVAVKLNSDGQNSILHYLCYVELTSSAQEPSPRYTVTFGQMGKASLRIKILRQHNKGKAKSTFAGTLTVGAKFAFRGNTHRRCEVAFRPSECKFRGNTHRRCEVAFRPSECKLRGNARRRRGNFVKKCENLFHFCTLCVILYLCACPYFSRITFFRFGVSFITFPFFPPCERYEKIIVRRNSNEKGKVGY